QTLQSGLEQAMHEREAAGLGVPLTAGRAGDGHASQHVSRVVTDPTDVDRRVAGQHVQIARALGRGFDRGQSAVDDRTEVGGGGIVRPAERAPDIEYRDPVCARQQRPAKLRVRLEAAPGVRGFPGPFGGSRAAFGKRLVVRRPAHAATVCDPIWKMAATVAAERHSWPCSSWLFAEERHSGGSKVEAPHIFSCPSSDVDTIMRRYAPVTQAQGGAPPPKV